MSLVKARLLPLVIASPEHGKNPLQKRVMIQVTVIGSGAPLAASECVAESRLSRLYLDCFVPTNDGVTGFVFISNPGHGKFLQRDNMEYTKAKPITRLPERVYCIPRTATLSDEVRGYPCIVPSDFISQKVIRELLKTYRQRHCECDIPKQSIDRKRSGLLPASYLAVAMTRKMNF